MGRVYETKYTSDMALAQVRAFRDSHDGLAPSVRDLATLLGCADDTVIRLLKKLEEEGRIKRHPGIQRGIVVVEPVPATAARAQRVTAGSGD